MKKLKWYIYPAFLIVFLLTAIVVAWTLSELYSNRYNKDLAAQLKTQAAITERLFAGKLNRAHAEEISQALKEIGTPSHSRITIALPDGYIVGDSHEDPSKIHNFSVRPEMKEALAGNPSPLIRYSYITNHKLVFVTYPVKTNGTLTAIIRIASSAEDPLSMLNSIGPHLLVIAGILFLAATAISFIVSQRVTKPLIDLQTIVDGYAAGDLKARVPKYVPAEFASLSKSLNLMVSQLVNRLKSVIRQRNELEVVLSSMMEAVIVLNANEEIIGMNQAAESLFDLNFEAVKGRTVQEAIRNSAFHSFVMKTLAEDKSNEADIVFMGDPERFLQATGATLLESNGGKIGIVIVLNDVTRLKTLENIRRDFVANVSHELKTPITSIKGFLETLKEGAINDAATAHRFLNILIKHTDRLDSIIEDLLSLSRIERDAERGEIALENGFIEDLVDAAKRACSVKAQSRNIELRTEIENRLSAKINARLLEQAIINLIDNAIKFSPANSTIQIQALTKDDEITISVKDQGSGISKEHQKRIFERFYRTDKARGRGVGGTGLGLSIVKHIVNTHGGRITVESSPNRGSEFTIFLPIRQMPSRKEQA